MANEDRTSNSSAKPALATTIADRNGDSLSKLERFFPEVSSRFDAVGVVATEVTDARDLDALRTVGAHVATGPAGADTIGRNRRDAVALALQVSAAHIVYADLDHLLRWSEADPAELDQVLREDTADCDCLVIGRGPASWAALPRRLADTEAIVNRVYSLITGRPWDLMMAARILSRRAARSIVAECLVDTIGNDVAWPLFCEQAGLILGYIEANGLTYRTTPDYAHDREDSLDGDPRAWATRVKLAWQQVEAMVPYFDLHERYPSN